MYRFLPTKIITFIVAMIIILAITSAIKLMISHHFSPEWVWVPLWVIQVSFQFNYTFIKSLNCTSLDLKKKWNCQ